MKIKTTWDYNLDHEAQRLIHVTSQIAVGFFKVNGFYPVPYGSVPAQYINVLLPGMPFPNLFKDCATDWKNPGFREVLFKPKGGKDICW